MTQQLAAVPAEQHDARWLKQRIDVNRAARFGLETATPAQLNVVWILCKRWGLDPVTDITLYQGHPWVTIEGHLRKLRDHPAYRGFSQRPLTEAERLAWGYEANDIVVETTIRTELWGDITQWGKVTHQEVADAHDQARQSGRRSAPVGTNPVEIAQKRSLARAHRAAFGMDAPDEAAIEREVTEEMAQRADPVRVKAQAERYDEIYGDFYDQPAAPALLAPTEFVTVPPEFVTKPEPQVTVRSQLGQRLADLVEDAARLEVEFEDARVSLPAPREQVVRAIEKLEDRLEAKKRKLAGAAESDAQAGF